MCKFKILEETKLFLIVTILSLIFDINAQLNLPYNGGYDHTKSLNQLLKQIATGGDGDQFSLNTDSLSSSSSPSVISSSPQEDATTPSPQNDFFVGNDASGTSRRISLTALDSIFGYNDDKPFSSSLTSTFVKDTNPTYSTSGSLSSSTATLSDDEGSLTDTLKDLKDALSSTPSLSSLLDGYRPGNGAEHYSLPTSTIAPILQYPMYLPNQNYYLLNGLNTFDQDDKPNRYPRPKLGKRRRIPFGIFGSLLGRNKQDPRISRMVHDIAALRNTLEEQRFLHELESLQGKDGPLSKSAIRQAIQKERREQHDWPRIFTAMGNSMDTVAGNINFVRKEMSKMRGQIISKGLLMAGSGVHQVSQGMAQVVMKMSSI